MREVILPQRDQQAVILAIEIEALGDGVVFFEQRFELFRRTVFDQIG